MLKKTIKYTNFNNEPKEMEVYFHLGKADIARLAADPEVLQAMNQAAVQNDQKKMLATIEHLVRMAYGLRSDDGERFVKSEAIADNFIQSAAYEEFLMEILSTTDGFTKFMKAVFPENMKAQVLGAMKQAAEEQGVPNPFAEPENPVSDKGVPADENSEDQPAWIRENRKPSKHELLRMPRTEMLEAFRRHPSLTEEIGNA